MPGRRDDARIADRVRHARARRGFTREQLAVRSGLSWSSIAQIETGRRTNLRPSTLAALAGALHVTVDHLIGHSAPDGLLEHRALVYEGDEEFAATVAPFLGDAVANGEPALAVTTRSKLRMLREALGADAEHVTLADSRHWYRTPGAALAAYRRFADEAIAGGAGWLRVVGEPVWSGRSEDEVRVWARYESLVNLAFAGMPLTLVCPYDAGALEPAIVARAQATHCEVTGAHGTSASPDYVGPGEFILRD
jgi:transcriptional regulator with XRE-family HTH domain